MISNDKKHKELSTHMGQKYRSLFMSSLAKLSVENPYDDKGIIKLKYILTENQKEALKFMDIPLAMDISTPQTNRNIEEGKIDDYDRFLNEVNTYTKGIVDSANFSKCPNKNVVWNIEGVEFGFVKGIYDIYSDRVKEQALSEVTPLRLKEGSTWRYERDYRNAQIKLGCLVHAGSVGSQILNLGL